MEESQCLHIFATENARAPTRAAYEAAASTVDDKMSWDKVKERVQWALRKTEPVVRHPYVLSVLDDETQTRSSGGAPAGTGGAGRGGQESRFRNRGKTPDRGGGGRDGVSNANEKVQLTSVGCDELCRRVRELALMATSRRPLPTGCTMRGVVTRLARATRHYRLTPVVVTVRRVVTFELFCSRKSCLYSINDWIYVLTSFWE